MNRAFNKLIKSHVLLTVLTVLAVALLTSGVTYSLFQIDKENTVNQVIAIGNFNNSITSSTGAIILNDLYPEKASDVGDEHKKYEFTIENNGDYDFKYQVYLTDATDTFLVDNPSYTSFNKLSTNYYQYINFKLDGSATPRNLESVRKEDKFIILEGILKPGARETHDLQFFIDSGDTTENGAPNDINGSILSLDIYYNGNAYGSAVENIIASAKTGNPDFSQVAITDEGVYSMEDDYGTSYYFRGAVENNYVKFAGFYWRIIRINGDGTVRMIYDGTSAHTNGESSTDRLALTGIRWNDQYNDAKYVGYMYGGTSATAASTTKEEAQTNTYPSTMKTTLETWYKENIADKGYSSAVADKIFCNDRSTPNSSYALGYGINETYYGAYKRTYDSGASKVPTFKCNMNSTINTKNDAFTVSDTTKGNGKLSYPVGLITADEILAGGSGIGSNNHYLYKGSWYWSFSPYDFIGLYAGVFGVNGSGSLDYNCVEGTGGVAPVINLSAEYASKFTGLGTMESPYEVVES